ncbi:hypothetical protein DENSPDRAFT_595718 [Dentipellis sp. KUC8613]|nr:hypothetical protein DENSPDRAFT_595718 [Dentipellis sp. KUC8613]
MKNPHRHRRMLSVMRAPRARRIWISSCYCYCCSCPLFAVVSVFCSWESGLETRMRCMFGVGFGLGLLDLFSTVGCLFAIAINRDDRANEYVGRARNSSADRLVYRILEPSPPKQPSAHPPPTTPTPQRLPGRPRSPRYRANSKPRASGDPICARPPRCQSRRARVREEARADAIWLPYLPIAPLLALARPRPNRCGPLIPARAGMRPPTLEDASFFVLRCFPRARRGTRGVDRARGCGSGTVRPRCSFASMFAVRRIAYVGCRHPHLHLHSPQRYSWSDELSTALAVPLPLLAWCMTTGYCCSHIPAAARTAQRSRFPPSSSLGFRFGFGRVGAHLGAVAHHL